MRGGPRILTGQVEMFELLIRSGAWGGIAVAHSVDEVCKLLDRWEIPRVGGKSWLAAVQPRLRNEPLGATFAKLAGGDSAQ